jgi:hypothetical protein
MDEHVQGECFCMGAGPQLTAMAKTLGPQAAMEHFRNSRVEFLKGLRSLIDSRIEKMSRKETKGSSVVVE